MKINNERNLTETRESRYTYLTELIKENNCKVILETGTWKGKNSVKMIQEALNHSDKKDVRYYGFDVWEQMTKELFEKACAAGAHESPLRRLVIPVHVRARRIRLVYDRTEPAAPAAHPR